LNSTVVAMSVLHQWLGSLKVLFAGIGSGSIERDLEEMAAQAEKAPSGARWAIFNRLGDAYLKTGDRPRALRYFGRAIDCLLEDDQPEPARAVAKKVIRLHPEAVRTLCTLTWIDLASLRTSAALSTLRDYADAAKEGEARRLACGQILEMARLTADPRFLEGASVALETLGCSADAARAREWADAGGSPDAPASPKDLYLLCLKAAIGSNATMKTKGTIA
jgi:tetratricopeptide (TPR) repeat protein